MPRSPAFIFLCACAILMADFSDTSYIDLRCEITAQKSLLCFLKSFQRIAIFQNNGPSTKTCTRHFEKQDIPKMHHSLLGVRMQQYQKQYFKVTPELQVFALREGGWGWSANENLYGKVIWPGAKAVSQVMADQLPPLVQKGCRILELGAGSGLCSIVCASLGASVLATDLNVEPLELAKAAADEQKLQIKIQAFDILGTEPLPPCDIVVAADCIYTPELGRGLAKRVLEARKRGATAIIGSAIKRPGYLKFCEELRIADCLPDLSKRIYDLTSPLLLLDIARGNYVQEVNIYR